MKNLIVSEEITISSREIADLTGKQHKHVRRDIQVMLNRLNIDQGPYLDFDQSGAKGRSVAFYNLTKELALTLVSGYSIQVRHKVVTRLSELEAQALTGLPDFTDPIQSAIAWADEVEAKLASEARLEVVRPLVMYAQAVECADDAIHIGTFAKCMGLGQNWLFGLLRAHEILISGGRFNNMPYQRFIDRGYFSVKQRTFREGGKRKLGHTTYLTGKGQVWLTNKLVKWGFLQNIMVFDELPLAVSRNGGGEF